MLSDAALMAVRYAKRQDADTYSLLRLSNLYPAQERLRAIARLLRSLPIDVRTAHVDCRPVGRRYHSEESNEIGSLRSVQTPASWTCHRRLKRPPGISSGPMALVLRVRHHVSLGVIVWVVGHRGIYLLISPPSLMADGGWSRGR